MTNITKIVLGIIIGISIGYILPKASSNPHASHPEGHGSAHTMLEIDTTKPVPRVLLEAFPDSKDGYNLKLTTTNFEFTPEKAGLSPVPNQGHAHLYINGNKIARVYGQWFHIASTHLVEGKNKIEVTLNANDHSDWALDGGHIQAEVIVEH